MAELSREKYLPAERRIIAELDEIGKPYLILLTAQNRTANLPMCLLPRWKKSIITRFAPSMPST